MPEKLIEFQVNQGYSELFKKHGLGQGIPTIIDMLNRGGGVDVLIQFIRREWRGGPPPDGFDRILRWLSEGLSIDKMVTKQTEIQTELSDGLYEPTSPVDEDIIKTFYRIESFLKSGNTITR